jgi:hypothetical protein
MRTIRTLRKVECDGRIWTVCILTHFDVGSGVHFLPQHCGTVQPYEELRLSLERRKMMSSHHWFMLNVPNSWFRKAVRWVFILSACTLVIWIIHCWVLLCVSWTALSNLRWSVKNAFENISLVLGGWHLRVVFLAPSGRMLAQKLGSCVSNSRTGHV